MKIKQIVSGMFAGVVLVSSLSLGAPAKAGEFCLDIWNDDCDLVPDSDLPEPDQVTDAIDDAIDYVQAETDFTVRNSSRYFINVEMYNEDNGNVEEFGLRAGESYTFNGAPSGNYTMSAATPNGQIMWGPKHIYTLDPTYTYSFR